MSHSKIRRSDSYMFATNGYSRFVKDKSLFVVFTADFVGYFHSSRPDSLGQSYRNGNSH